MAEIEPLAQQALQMGQEVQNPNATIVFTLQTALLYREQGRNQELEPLLMGSAGMYPLILPNLQCALAVLHCEQGRATEARAEFDQLAAHDFTDLPRNLAWLFSVAHLSEACAFLGDGARAQTLYEMLAPFAQQNVMVSPIVASGAAARYLGLLASTMRRWQEAEAHFEDALAMNAQLGMRNALVRTQVDYAGMLLTRGTHSAREKALALLARALDSAGELGMKLVLERALTLKLQAQGVVPADCKTSIDSVASAVQRERPDLRRHAAPDGTVTVLFSDIEGSAAIAERLGDQGWLRLLRVHDAIVREQVTAHAGFEVKSQGDGFMLAFQSARRALLCAIGIQRAFATHNAQAGDQPLHVRIGLHAGEVIRDGEDFFGKNVILAARIAAQAKGGEILTSSVVKELTHAAGDLRFGPGREAELKGLTGTYVLYPVHPVVE